MKWRNRQREQKNPTRRRLKAYAAAVALQAPPGGFEPIGAVVDRLRKEAEQKRREDEGK